MQKNTGPYLLVAKLGEGGMAEVFKAVKKGPDGWEKPIALKRILPHLADQAEFIRMLSAEARLQAKLDHPNVVHIYDFFEHETTYFIAMEYVAGKNLKQIVRQSKSIGKAIPWQASVHIVSEMLRGLDHAHRRSGSKGPLNIVHRDISPQNILISHDGYVKLSDFGIAWANIERDETRSGVMKGKHRYLSPEQLQSSKLDFRADLFSTGVVLYELLSGQHPFESVSEFETMKKIERGEFTPLRELSPELPQAVLTSVDRALVSSPTDRFGSAGEFRELLLSEQDPQWLMQGAEKLADLLQEIFPDRFVQEDLPIEATPILTRSGTPLSTINPAHSLISDISIKPNTAQSSGSLFRRFRLSRKMASLFLFLALAGGVVAVLNVFEPFPLKVPGNEDAALEALPEKSSTQSSSSPATPIPTQPPMTTPEPTISEATQNTPKPSPPVKANPQKKYGLLNIHGPVNSQVFINGKLVGILPIKQRRLRANQTYQVTVAPPNARASSSRISVSGGQTKNLRWVNKKNLQE